MYKQKTLKSSFSLSGKGLHTGLELTVTFNPAPADYGYRDPARYRTVQGQCKGKHS